MPEAKIIHIGRPKPKAEQCPSDMIDAKKIREVPLDGPLHKTLQAALAQLNFVPIDLDTLQEIERFRHENYRNAKEFARATGIGLPAVYDILAEVLRKIAEECTP